MVSGRTSKATRNTRPKVVQPKSTPWGLIAGVVVVALFAGAVFGYAWMRTEENQAQTAAMQPFTPSAENTDPSTQIPGVEVVPFEGGVHVDRATQVAYTHQPPMGGAHDFSWATCNGVVYPEAVRNENMVHALEHGTVWIAYNPDQVSGAALDTLRSKVEGEQYMMLSPYPGLDQPISLQSWGHQLKLADANDPRIDQFITALRINQYQHPEPGASCNEIGPQEGGFSRNDPPPFAAPPAPGTPGVYPESVANGAPAAPVAPPAAGSPMAPAAPQAPAEGS